jgi:DNA-binding NarL/FixJ family response regulator
MTATKKPTSNYTDEQAKDLAETYKANPSAETVEALAEKYGKGTKSIIAKLVNLKVYTKPDAASKSAKGETKDTIVSEIANLCNVTEDLFGSLTGASKKVLVALRDGLRNKAVAVEVAKKNGVENLPDAAM